MPINQALIENGRKALEEKICPIINHSCLLDKCWKFQERKLIWAEQEMVKNAETKRLEPVLTGKIINGTEVSCFDRVFQQMIVAANYVDEGKYQIKDGIVCTMNGRPVNEADIVEIGTFGDEKENLDGGEDF